MTLSIQALSGVLEAAHDERYQLGTNTPAGLELQRRVELQAQCFGGMWFAAAWNGKGSGPSYHPAILEVAVLVAETPLEDPVADQYALIERHRPRDNVMDGHTLWFRMVTRRRKMVADEG